MPVDAAPQIDAVPAIDAAVAPVFRNPVDMADDALALAALQRLGAPVENADFRCEGCHSLTNAQLHNWIDLSAAAYPCIDGVDATSPGAAASALTCLENDAPGGLVVNAPRLGLWATAGRLPWFEALHASAGASYPDFLESGAMPPAGGDAFNQGEFDVVAEWVLRGAPLLDTLVPPENAPTTCTPLITAEVGTRLTALATTGWQQKNKDANLAMYGCAGAANTLACMADQPRATARAYATTWEVAPGNLRILAEMPNYASSFWTRSSADGRFVAQGGGDGIGGSTIIDLLDDHHIGVDASYDPTFFPDNSGFIFQGNGHNTCAQSILLGGVASISMSNDPACTSTNVNLYQHVGRAIDGDGDYFASFGNFVSDFGGGSGDPYAFFGQGDTVSFSTMTFDGSTYSNRSTTDIAIPYEGDAAVSSSTKFMMTRQGNVAGTQLAYVLHAVDAIENGAGYDITAPIVGSYCLSGGKPGFSYDDRYVVYHHAVDGTSDAEAQELGFVDANDAGFQGYVTDGATNIWMVDLLTGLSKRITRMNPGQFALFPHFRSDGWIYFIVKDSGNEYVVGADARLRE